MLVSDGVCEGLKDIHVHNGASFYKGLERKKDIGFQTLFSFFVSCSNVRTNTLDSLLNCSHQNYAGCPVQRGNLMILYSTIVQQLKVNSYVLIITDGGLLQTILITCT